MKPSSDVVGRMKRQRGGHLHPVFVYLETVDPAFLTAYNELAVLNFNYGKAAKGRALSAKIKELIAVALLASVRGGTTRQHVERALSVGASPREVVEALEMSMHITGAPSLEFGLSQMLMIDAKSRKK